MLLKLPELVSSITETVGIAFVGVLTVIVLIIGIIYPVPWLWQHLCGVLSIPIILLWLGLLCVLLLVLALLILELVGRLASFLKLVSAYLSVFVFSRLPIAKRIAMLKGMDHETAWNTLWFFHTASGGRRLLEGMDQKTARDALLAIKVKVRQTEIPESWKGIDWKNSTGSERPFSKEDQLRDKLG